MSIAPNPKKEEFGMTYFDRIRHIAKTATNEYFKNPLFYLFYSMLAGVAAGLLFNADFSWQTYALLGVLGALHLWQERPKT